MNSLSRKGITRLFIDKKYTTYTIHFHVVNNMSACSFCQLYSTFVTENVLQLSPLYFLLEACLFVSYWSDSPEQVEACVLRAVLQSDIDHAEGFRQLAFQSSVHGLLSGLFTGLLQLLQQGSGLRTRWVQHQRRLHVLITL